MTLLLTFFLATQQKKKSKTLRRQRGETCPAIELVNYRHFLAVSSRERQPIASQIAPRGPSPTADLGHDSPNEKKIIADKSGNLPPVSVENPWKKIFISESNQPSASLAAVLFRFPKEAWRAGSVKVLAILFADRAKLIKFVTWKNKIFGSPPVNFGLQRLPGEIKTRLAGNLGR